MSCTGADAEEGWSFDHSAASSKDQDLASQLRRAIGSVALNLAEEYADTKTWVGRGYAPEKFNITAVNKKLATLARKLERQQKRA